MIRPSVMRWFLDSIEGESGQRDGLGALEKLTVVIPTYGRQEFILRQAVYWRASSAQVLFVDGSPQPLSHEVQEVLARQANMRYLHLADTMWSRLRLAVEHIHTPYAVSLGDDEFHLEKGLRRAIEKLETDSSFVACIGQSVRFHPAKEGSTITYSAGYPHWRYNVAHDEMRDRLLFAMGDYSAATCYAVLRRSVWARSWGQLQSWSYLPAAELEQAIVTYIYGKLTTIDEVYWLRSDENPQVKIEAVWEPNRLPFENWWLSPEFKTERENFVEKLANEAVAASHIELPKSKSIVTEAMWAYCRMLRSKSRSLSSLRAAAINGIRSKMSRLLRMLLAETMVQRIEIALKRTNGGDLGGVNAVRRLKGIGAVAMDQDSFDELARIEALIAGFREARLSES